MEEQVKSNPLLEKNKAAIPGVVFRLPSKGKIYDEGIIADDVENGEVLVYPMRLKEEIKMKSPDSILQGSAVSETIRYCVPQIIEPTRLSPEDVDYLLVAIKKMTHGPTIQFKDVCMKLKDQNIDLTDVNVMDEMDESKRTEEATESPPQFNPEGEEAEGEEAEDDGKKEKESNINNLGENSKICSFKISLDFFINNAKEIKYEEYKENLVHEFKNFEIEFKPVTFKDFKDASVMDLQENPDMSEDEYFDYINERSNKALADRIKRVDETTDHDFIYEWIDRTLSLSDREKLFERISEIQDWGVDFEYNLTCSTCGKSKKTTQSQINPLYFFLMS